jgi:DHA2 family multidrug resistance protein
VSTPSWVMPRAQRYALTAASVLATMLMAIDLTIASVALPEIQGTFAATTDQVSWVLTSYVIALAIATPVVDAVVDRVGRRRTFLAAVIGFTVTSGLCGLAWSLESITLFRFAQGVFAAGLVPIAQAVLLDSHPPERHGAAMAWWTIGVMIGPIVGPVLGGWLTQGLEWRWIFWINLPFGAFAAVVIAAFLPRDVLRPPRGFDALGYVLLAIAVAVFQFVIERGERYDWFESTAIVAGVGVALASAWAFAVHSWTTQAPFFSRGLFRDANFVSCLVVTFVTHGVFFANLGLLSPFMQNVLGYPPDAAGEMIAPRGAGVLVGVVVASGLRRWIPDRVLVIAGLVASAAGIHAMTRFSPQVDVATITWAGVVQGVGYGVMFGPLTTATFATLPSALRTEGAALVQLMRQISGGLALAGAVAFMTRNGHGFEALLRGSAQAGPSAAWIEGGARTTALLAGEVARQGAMLAYLRTVDWLALSLIVTLPLSLLIRPPRRDAPPPPAVEPA